MASNPQDGFAPRRKASSARSRPGAFPGGGRRHRSGSARAIAARVAGAVRCSLRQHGTPACRRHHHVRAGAAGGPYPEGRGQHRRDRRRRALHACARGSAAARRTEPRSCRSGARRHARRVGRYAGRDGRRGGRARCASAGHDGGLPKPARMAREAAGRRCSRRGGRACGSDGRDRGRAACPRAAGRARSSRAGAGRRWGFAGRGRRLRPAGCRQSRRSPRRRLDGSRDRGRPDSRATRGARADPPRDPARRAARARSRPGGGEPGRYPASSRVHRPVRDACRRCRDRGGGVRRSRTRTA